MSDCHNLYQFCFSDLCGIQQRAERYQVLCLGGRIDYMAVADLAVCQESESSGRYAFLEEIGEMPFCSWDIPGIVRAGPVLWFSALQP